MGTNNFLTQFTNIKNCRNFKKSFGKQFFYWLIVIVFLACKSGLLKVKLSKILLNTVSAAKCDENGSVG